jgi:16S rRNA processing protein RimM
MSDEAPLIELGSVGAPFGVRGWIKVRSYTDPPERIFEHRNLRVSHNGLVRSYVLEATGKSGGQLTAKLAGIADRDQAQALRGAAICVPRSELPARDEKEFYRADLLGCEVVNLAGERLGIVQHFLETPQQVLMVVKGEQEFWVPAVPQHLRRIDLKSRRVTVDWSMAAD